MNKWTKLSIDIANKENYLDKLFSVYPTIPEESRDIDSRLWGNIETCFKKHNDMELIIALLRLDLFPLKDSYVAYFRRYPDAIERNPENISRLAKRLYEMGLEKIYERCREPKETNRQIGPMFRDWIHRGGLSVPILPRASFLSEKKDCVLEASDAEMMAFARDILKYDGDKGLDFVGKYGGNYIVGEAKFLTDFGGHQNAQFEDAKNLLKNSSVRAIKVAIIDGVLYIPGASKGGNKMFRYLTEHKEQYNIFSSLLLKDFLSEI